MDPIMFRPAYALRHGLLGHVNTADDVSEVAWNRKDKMILWTYLGFPVMPAAKEHARSGLRVE